MGRLGMAASQLEAMGHGFQASAMAIQTILDALSHIVGHTFLLMHRDPPIYSGAALKKPIALKLRRASSYS